MTDIALDPRIVSCLAAREMRQAWRNRWFLLFVATFAAAALALAWLSGSGVAIGGFAGLERTALGLTHLVVLIVPLAGLALGALAVAGERERGALLALLAQPVTASEIVLGKLAGLGGAIALSLSFGFGIAGLALAARGGGSAAAFLAFLALALLLALAAVSVGLAVSSLATGSPAAAGLAVFFWLILVFLGDLGLMGTSIALRLEPGTLLAASLVNPAEAFKVGSLAVLGGLETLGPAGLYAARVFDHALVPLTVAILLLWIAGPLAIAVWGVRRRGGLT